MLGHMVLIRFIVSGFILGAMSYSAGDDAGEEEAFNDDFYNEDSLAVASTLFAIVLINVMGLGLSVPFINSHYRMLKSEISSGIYTPISAWCALFIHEVPLQVVGAMLLAVVVRLFLQIEDNAKVYYGAVFLCALCSSSLAVAIAGISKSAYRSAQLYLTWASVICLFCGYLRTIPDMPEVFQWLTDFSFGRWAFQLLMLSVFQDTQYGDYYLDDYGFKNQAMRTCVFWLLVWLLGLQVLVLLRLFPFPYKSVYSRLDRMVTKEPRDTPSGNNSLHLLDKSSIISVEGSYMDVTQHRMLDSDTPALPPPVVSLPETKKTSLSFEDVGYSIKAEDASSNQHFMSSLSSEDKDAVILKGISGCVMPGELCCIIDGGEEGAGEILLQILSGRANVYGNVLGNIRISDKTLLQGDFVHNSVMVNRGDPKSNYLLTVRESLEFSALLRRTDQRSCPLVIHMFLKWRQASLWRKMRSEGRRQTAADDFIEFNDEEIIATTGQVEEKVDEVLRVFDLESVADVMIGYPNPTRTISPSQMRLLTIATEALNKPGLLYLQDPFFELDWYHANRVCRVLKAAVAGGRAIICTIPSPTNDIFVQCDTMLLINRGMLLYHGQASLASEHFKNIGFEPKENQTDLSFLMDICHEKAHMGSVSISTSARKTSLLTTEDLVNIRISMSSSTDIMSRALSHSLDMDTVSDAPPSSIYTPMMGPVVRRSDASFGPASRVIATRRTLAAYRNRSMVWYYLACSLLFSFILGGMWYSLDDGDIHGRVRISAVAYIYMTASLAGLLNGTHRRQDDYLRERDSGASTGTSYWLGDGAPVVMHSAPHVVIFSMPFYFLAGLRPGFAHFCYYCVLFFFAVYCNLGLMYLVTGVTKNALMSRVIYLGILLPLQLIFSGSIIYLSTMYDWLSAFAYLNPMQYFMSGTFTNEFHDNEDARGSDDLTYQDIKDKYGFYGSLEGSVIALLVIGVCYRILWLFSLRYREIYEKRHVLTRVMSNAQSRVSNFVSRTGLRLSSTTRPSRHFRGGRFASTDKKEDVYFNADELDLYENDMDEGDDDDSDQLSSKHSISEFVLSPHQEEEDDGLSMTEMRRIQNSYDYNTAGSDIQTPTLFRREMPQIQVTPPSRQSGHNRIIIAPKSGSKGGSSNNTPDTNSGLRSSSSSASTSGYVFHSPSS